MVAGKGYKQTEIGIIPEDWEVKSIEAFADIIGGGTPSTSYSSFWNGNINWFTPTEIGKEKYVYESVRKITPEGLKKSSAKILPIGAILLTSRATIGDISILQKESCTNQGFQSLIAKKNVNNEYLYYILSIIKDTIISLASGSTFLEISPNKLRKIQLSIPSIPEQTAIATVLSDMDEYILSLEQLIAKKKAVKQGTMQNLLTGKIRLTGFKGEWVETSISDITVRAFAGGTPSTFNADYWGGTNIWLQSGRCQNNIVKKTPNEICITNNGLNESAAKLIKGNSVLIAITGATCGNIAFLPFVAAANQSVVALETNEKTDSKFLYYLLLTKRDVILSFQTGSAQGGVNLNTIKNIHLTIPEYLEQTAIATILSDMDAEIETLQAKSRKAKQVKQGAMQQLLTGKIRLTKNNKSTAIQQSPIIELKPKKKGHNDQINEAVVISFLVHKFGTAQYPLSRFRYTKYAYLLHRQMEHEATGFLKHAAGPYKSENRYKGGEGIALRNQYISKVENPLSGADAFVVNENINEALAYFDNWYGVDISHWIETFRYYKNDDLEVLTTVDKSVCDLTKQRKLISVSSIKEYIRSIPKWKAKLDKPCFNDFNIQKAINESFKLFGG